MVPDRMLTTLRSPWRGNKARLWLLPILIVSVVSLCGCTKDLVTGKRTYNFFSLKTDIKMGKEVLSQQLGEFRLKGVKVDNDPEMVGRIREMVTKIAVISHIPQFPYEAHYARVPIANAWCAPGGKIMVYEGLFSEKDGLVDRNKEAELAAVLGLTDVDALTVSMARGVAQTVSLDTAALASIRNAFYTQVSGAMNELKVAPFFLKDSAKTTAERERLAASRIDAYFDLLLAEQAQFVNIPEPVSAALRKKYESRVVAAGIERALERATKIRQVSDSTRAAQQPTSAVPMPGAAPGAPNSAAQPAEPAKKP